LSEHARAEWERVSPELHRLGLLTVLDVATLCAYTASFSRWRAAEIALLEIGAKDPVTHGLLIKDADGNARVNPLTRVARDAADAMIKFASELGCTPVARARIAAGPYGGGGGPSKFGDLIA
jgi:P27 family predicted phage terminase small subunit